MSHPRRYSPLGEPQISLKTAGLNKSTGWRTKCHTIDCARNTFYLLQKHLTSGTELILIGWKIVPNEEHVQCDHHFASFGGQGGQKM